jgi:Mg-chelatase subunit ChlD
MDSERSYHEDIEARLTALLLGELPAEEAVALQEAIAQDPDLAKLYERLKETIALVRETEHSPATQTAAEPAPLTLSEDRRQKLLAHFKTVAPKEFGRQPRRRSISLVELGVAAALVGLVSLGVLLPLFNGTQRAFRNASVTALYQEPAQWAANNALDRSLAGTPKGPMSQHDVVESGRETSEMMKRELEQMSAGTPHRADHQAAPLAPPAEPIAAAAATTIVLPPKSEATAPLARSGPQPVAGNSETSLFDDLSKQRKEAALVSSPSEAPAVSPAKPASLPESNPLIQRSKTPGTEVAMQKNLPSAVPEFAGTGGGMGGGGGGVEPTTGLPVPAAGPVAAEQASAGRPGALALTDEDHQRNGNALAADATVRGISQSAPQNFNKDKEHLDVLAQRKSAEVAHDERRALGFNWYLGDQLQGKDGKAPDASTLSSANPAGVPNGDKVTALGDLPVAGRLFRAKKEAPEPTLSAWSADQAGVVVVTNSVADALTANQGISNNSTFAINDSNTYDGFTFYRQRSQLETAGETPLPWINGSGNTAASEGARDIRNSGYIDNSGVWNSWTGNGTKAPDFKGSPVAAKPQGTFSPAETAANSSGSSGGSTIVLPPVTPPSAGHADFALEPETRQSITITDRDASDNARQRGEESKTAPAVPSKPAKSGLITSENETAAPVPRQMAQEVAINESATRQPDNIQAYWAAEQKLVQLTKIQQALDLKVFTESVETNSAGKETVEIVGSAKAQSGASPSFLGRLGAALTGEVERRAMVKVQRDQSDIAGTTLPQSTPSLYDPYFIQTEFEVIRSEPVLGKVVDDLKLDEAWAKKGGAKVDKAEAVRLLRQQLDLRPVQNTNLIEIGVKSVRSEEAATIANAIAKAYQIHWLEQRNRLAQYDTEALMQRLRETEKQVAVAKADVERLRRATNAPQMDAAPPKPPAGAPIPQPEIQTCDNPFSTFSLNVSDVSFKLAAASLEKGVLPGSATIRSEEFINAFDYRDPEPPPGVPIAFAWDRAGYPFSQNRDLLRFSLKTAAQGRQAGRPLNLVLLLDNSGSMERADRVRIIHEALRVLATQLHAKDTLSVVTFARTARLWVDGVPGSQAGQVADELSGLTPEGGTNLEEAMNLAYQTALRHYLPNGINRVVLLTDGAANLGNIEPDALKKKVEDHRRQGIALDCFGIGWEGYNDDLLEVLSRNGDGRYGFLNTPEEAATEFAGQLAGALRVAAADVKVQVEFNPDRVTAYRQIGYAKHQLTKEQFRDNTVDAAEIGAAESGNALYVVAINPAGEGPLATVRVRYKVPGTTEYHEHEWAVPYTGSAAALDQAGPAMRLAATASSFSEWLASPYAAEVTPDRLLGYLTGLPEMYGADARPKKLEWMLRQAKSLAGK